MITKDKIQNQGFTLTELLVTIAILVIVTGAVYLGYNLSQKAYREGAKAAEITQNGRVIIERMNREIRQTKKIVTELSASSTDATSEIEFEDGHDTSYVHYIHYFRDEADLTVKREVIAYYFSPSGDPNSTSTYAIWDALPPLGETLATTTLEDPKIIGEYVTDLKFWGSKVINIALTLNKKGKTLNLETKIFSRNF